MLVTNTIKVSFYVLTKPMKNLLSKYVKSRGSLIDQQIPKITKIIASKIGQQMFKLFL